MPMQVIYAPEAPPETFAKSIFLAGPSPRKPKDPNWRPRALEMLERLGYDGVVFVPLPRDGSWSYGYDQQVAWELARLEQSDAVAFWVPRSRKLPAFTTNVEFGMFFDSGKAILGYPKRAPKMGYLDWHAKRQHVPVVATLKETLRAAVRHVGAGASRTGGERAVPLHIWNLPHFQAWITTQKAAGNRLDGARLLWSFRVGARKEHAFAYALHVDIHVAKEGRNKANEFILSRPDIAAVVGYRPGKTLADTEVVLVREFRATARTEDGFIREAAGGSSWKAIRDPRQLAAQEFHEETGLRLRASRFRSLGARQACGTFSTHRAHAFACTLSKAQVATLRRQQADGIAHGVAAESERTHVEVYRLGELLARPQLIDWPTLGMVLAAVGATEA